MTYELKSCPFCAKSLTNRNGINQYGRCDTEGCWMAEAKIGISCDDPKQVKRWNTRPAPAATDTGLETLGFVHPTFVTERERGYDEIFRTVRVPENWEPVVTRSQAVELLAAETKLKQHWKDEAERFRIEFEKAAYKYLLAKARAEKSEADNGAKDALIVQLRAASASDFDTMLALNSRIDDLLATLAEVERD